MCVIYVVESHEEILKLWQAQNLRSLKILHLDFHCDLRGLLINRKTQLAYRIWDIKKGLDQGNFLTHAVLEGRIKSLRWVHDIPGGRQYDVGTVMYESDLTVILYRWLFLKGKPGIPIDYQVIKYSNWTDLYEGESLDIDWDFFACMDYPPETIQDRVNAFLERKFPLIPKQVYICYSPDYSHPSRDEFQSFYESLARKFNAKLILIKPDLEISSSPPFYKRYLPSVLFRIIRQLYYGINLELRKRGIY